MGCPADGSPRESEIMTRGVAEIRFTTKMKIVRNALMTVVLITFQHASFAAVTGRIAGTIADPSGAAIPGTRTQPGKEARAFPVFPH